MAVAKELNAVRVMHIITHLDLGGAEGVALQLLEGLHPRVVAAIFAVLQAGASSNIGLDMARRAHDAGASVYFGTGRGFKSGGVVVAAWRLVRALREFRPDVIHVHTEIPELTLAVACMIWPPVARIPLLRTVHNSVLWISWGRIGQLVTRRLAHGRAIAVSDAAAQADLAIDTGNQRPRAEVIYNAVPSPPPMVSTRARTPLRILFAGRLVHQKGADLLPAIIAGAQANARRCDVEVIIAGDGAFKQELSAAFAGWSGRWQVKMIDPISGLSHRLDDYDIYLLPSRFEGLSLLHLEVLVAGLPLITCRVPGVAEVLPADYALACEPEDTLVLAKLLAAVVDDIEAARDVALRHRPALRERFAPDRMLLAYLEQYRALAGCLAEKAT